MTTAPAESPKAPALSDRVVLALLRLLLMLPYRWRVPVAGWIGTHVLGHIGRFRTKVAASVRHFLPDLPEADVQRIARAVPGNYARMLIEIYSSRDFARFAGQIPLVGPGLAALQEAQQAKRPVVLVSAHFGNYEAWRLGLWEQGFNIGAYFKEQSSESLNAPYVDAILASGQPTFFDTIEGRKGMVRFLRSGGILGILIDVDRPNGVMLDFLGQPTRTVLSMAELALRYDALLVPAFGIRTDAAPGFTVEIGAPIPHSDPLTMTQALNDAFGAVVRAHPEQWVWWHNRRKKSHPNRQPTA